MRWYVVFVRWGDNIAGVGQKNFPVMTFALRPQWYEEPGTEDGKAKSKCRGLWQEEFGLLKEKEGQCN